MHVHLVINSVLPMHMPNSISSCREITRMFLKCFMIFFLLYRKYFCPFIFNENKNDSFDRIPVDLLPVVYCTVISEGSSKEWEYLWNKFKSENMASEQVTILNALGCTKHAKLISVHKKSSFQKVFQKFIK